ncbi:MAG: CRISPR-associated protein Cas5 [Desulfovibrio sp.]|nr:CRISPR-associated protein Cas5 [Desulfovibrio sp.]
MVNVNNSIKTVHTVTLEIAGHTAMWTRPDSGDVPVSYPAPTYSAVKAIFESVLWGPAVEIVPERCEICRPLAWHAYYTNYGGPLRKVVRDGNSFQLLATVLVDVCYRLHATVVPFGDKSKLNAKALAWDGKTTSPGHAYKEIFERRLKRGQSHTIPFLGWREFTPSYFGAFRKDTQVCADMERITLPSMMRRVFNSGYKGEVAFEYDTDVVIESGVLCYDKRAV